MAKPEFNLAAYWIATRRVSSENKEDFYTYIFSPFVELLDWYLKESNSSNPKDYFSKDEALEYSSKIDDIIDKLTLQGFGQEILFEEIHDLKEQLYNLNKKNWQEIVYGKLLDMVLRSIISMETFKIIVNSVLGRSIWYCWI